MPKAAKTTTTKSNRKAATKEKVDTAKDNAKKATRKSTKKNSSEPKRNLTAYMFFSIDFREKVKQENPKASFGDIAKLLGKKWNVMSEKEKAPYVKNAEEDKKRYEKEKAVMEESKVTVSDQDVDQDVDQDADEIVSDNESE